MVAILIDFLIFYQYQKEKTITHLHLRFLLVRRFQ